MGPAEKRSLEAAISELNSQQSDAIKDATYVGWTQESKVAFDDRRKRITKLSAQLGQLSSSDLIQH